MALSERPLTIGCCQSSASLSPNSEMMRHQADDLRSPQPSPLVAERNYEGQGASPQRLPLRWQTRSWWGSPLFPDASLQNRSQRRRSGHSSGSSTTDDGCLSVIDKEDLLDTIFIDCDTDGKGRVAVSRVIQHIQMIVESNESRECRDIDELALQLDPTGLDLEIDLPTYQSRIAQWIQSVQNQRKLEVSGVMDDRPNTSNIHISDASTPETIPHWKTISLDGGTAHLRNVSTPLSDTRPYWKTRNPETSHLFSGPLDSPLELSTCSYGSLEAQGGDSTTDMADLQNCIEDLQFKIRKLSEHNMKLHVQIEAMDDANDQLMSQIDSLKSELKSLQQAWHRSQSIRDENEELKLTNKDLHKKHAELGRDKHILDVKVVSLQTEANKRQAIETKLMAAQEELSISLANAESIQEDHRKLQTVLQEYKRQSEETEAHLEVKNAELAKKSKRCEEMQVNLEEVYNLNRVLKAEKTQLEVKLSEVRQELDSFQQLVTPRGEVCTTSPTSSKTESGLGRSLHSELKSLVSADGNLPSPICGNEDFDFEKHTDGSSVGTPDTLLSRQPSFISTSSSTSSETKLLVHFQQRKEEVMKQLQGFLDENANEGECPSKVAFTNLLGSELDSMVEMITSLAKTKKASEHRANKLSFMLQSLQDDYMRISKKYEEAIKHCKELTATKSELKRVRTDNEMLQFDIQKGRRRTEELEKNLSSCQMDLESAHVAQQKYRQMAETQLGELRRLFKEMEKKYKVAQDNARKQEAEYKAKVTQQSVTHHTQLKAVLDLVSTSSCVDQSLPQVAAGATQGLQSNSPHSDNILESVSAYLTGLKTQLAKVRGQLISLKREKFSLEHRPLHLKRVIDWKGCLKPTALHIAGIRCGCNNNRPCSILLDALTLEVADEDSQGHSNSLLLHHQSAQSLQQQLPHLSQDDTLVDSLRASPSTLIDKLHDRLVKEFKTTRRQKSATASTQTEILRTPDRQVRPYSRSSYAQTGVADTQSRDTDTQTDRDSIDGADVKQAYLINTPPTLNSAVLLPIDKVSSLGDSLSELNDSFVTALSSPVSCSPRRGSVQDSLERDDFLGSPFTRNDSLESPYSSPEQEPSDCPESSVKSLVFNPDNKLQSQHRTSSQDRLEAAQRMADMLADSYARPNIVVEGCQADCEDNDLNANYDRSGKYSPSTPRKLSLSRLKRRPHVDKEKDKRTSALGSDGKNQDLPLGDTLPDMNMMEQGEQVSQRLLEAAKKGTERHKNRRGRRWSPSTSPDQRSMSPSSGDRSRSPSPSQSPSQSPSPVDDQSSTAEKPVEMSEGVAVPTADKVTDGTADSTGELQEERTGAEGESDKEDGKLTAKSERKDSEVEVFDIKADILKATGPLQAEMPQVKPIMPLAKLREEHKLQRKTNIHFTMPDLTEATESDHGRDNTAPSTGTTSLSSPHPTPVPQSPVPENQFNLREDCTTIGHEEGEGEKEEKEPEGSSALSEEKSLLPDSVLSKLGLKCGYAKDTGAMTENEIEEKFNTLQLAFKANQYTLQKRVMLQHRQRDMAEKNIDREIEGLVQTLQMLEPLATVDTVSRDYINRIRQHVDVLQSSSLRLSSKAEGFGAVQQEGRLSKATDVMITHVENLKRLFEREHAELEDARKLLQENRKLFRGNNIMNNFSIDGDTDSKLLSRRALSISGGNSKKPTSLFQLAKMLKNSNKTATSGEPTKGIPVVTQIHHQSFQVHPYSPCETRKRSVSCVVSPRFGASNTSFPEFNAHEQTGRRRASVATVVGSGLLSSSYGSQPLSFGGQHSRSQTEPAGISLGQVSRTSVRRTSVQLSSTLNGEDFKETKARLTSSLSMGPTTRHAPLSRTDSSVISRRLSDDGPTELKVLEGPISAPIFSPTSPPSPASRDAVSLPATPMVSTFPKIIDPEVVKRGVTKGEGKDLKGSKKEEDAFQQGYEQGIRTHATQELVDLREQQKAFCNNLEDLIDQAEDDEQVAEAEKEIHISKSSNRIIQRLNEIGHRWPRATRIARLILTTCIFLFALAYVIITVVPLESCLSGSPVAYSPWRTMKELLWPYTELRHHNPPPR